ncbi:MAG TPA: MEDS domain-containing protein [Acidobacteriaceae bacterium]|jgi:hypothetical protein
METLPRHQCLIYDGAPSRHLAAVAAVTRDKLEQDYRCLYLNSPPMVAGMRSYLAAAGVDIEHEVGRGSLVLTSEQGHLAEGRFDAERMVETLEAAIQLALRDGYVGLWATGDMTWEMGTEKDFTKLVEYEWRLEKLFAKYPELSGICQYHASTVPRDAMRQGLLVHPTLFVSETLSLLNVHYVGPDAFRQGAGRNAELDAMIGQLCRTGSSS